jgi:hypothetical protein
MPHSFEVRTDPIDGSGPKLPEVLAAVEEYLNRYVSFTSPHQSVAVALWVAFTHAFDPDLFEVIPYLNIESAEKRSGKTLLLDILDQLAANTMSVGGLSAAALFRIVDQHHPTLLIDEVDSIFKARRGSRDASEDLRLERGETDASPEVKARIARALRVPIAEVFPQAEHAP